MPVTLNEIASNTASVTIPVGEKTVTVVYYPGRITEKAMAQMRVFSTMNADNAEAAYAGFNDMLARIIKSWDIFEDDEQTVMFPLEPDRLSEVPIQFRIQVENAIVQDIFPPEVVEPQLNGHG